MFKILTTAIPVADGVEHVVSWMTKAWAGFFSAVQWGGKGAMDAITRFLVFLPPVLVILGLAVAAYFVANRKKGLPIFVLIGLLFVYNQGLWEDMMNTVTLVFMAALLSVVIGIPLGILMAKKDRAQVVIQPILDFMQTMPAFVYLIPAVAFFGIGMVPGVFASIIFALPPTVRFTNLGIREIPRELIEASDAFGSTSSQKLFKIELPLARNTIMAGINQTIMLALSMVVTASMIGAPGLGRGVLSALQRAQVGNGFVSGMALVVLAIIIDRFTQKLAVADTRRKAAAKAAQTNPKRRRVISGVVAALVMIGVVAAARIGSGSQQEIKLAYVQWDSEVASTHVIAEVLKDQGYKVTLIPLDNAVMWESVARGESDAMVSAWLPNTHRAQYKQYRKELVNLGANLTGAKLGLVVPDYMRVDSIADLSTEAGQTVTGIEAGSGVVTAAEKTVKTYPNLKGWKVTTTSSGTMATALGKAIDQHQLIIVTGWSPHWMFQKYHLKYLKDPRGTMGKTEHVSTMVRKGLKSDMPKAYRILNHFHWTTDDISSVMLDIQNGMDPKKAARKWVKAHPDQVARWTR